MNENSLYEEFECVTLISIQGNTEISVFASAREGEYWINPYKVKGQYKNKSTTVNSVKAQGARTAEHRIIVNGLSLPVRLNNFQNWQN